MKSVPIAAILILLGLAGGSEALAQRDVPVERDIQRAQRLDRRIDRHRPPPVDPNVTPDNPDGVVGFDGPPGIFENGVDRGGPIEPGSPADMEDD